MQTLFGEVMILWYHMTGSSRARPRSGRGERAKTPHWINSPGRAERGREAAVASEQKHHVRSIQRAETSSAAKRPWRARSKRSGTPNHDSLAKIKPAEPAPTYRVTHA